MAKQNIARQMLGAAPSRPSPAESTPALDKPAATPPPPARSGREQTVVKLTGALASELKDAVWWLRQYVNPAATVSAIVEEAVRRQLADLKQLHNDGQDFPARTGELPRGRPMIS